MRLIDADAMADSLEYDVELDARALDSTDLVGPERERVQFDKDCKQNCMWYLTEQATIPAPRWYRVEEPIISSLEDVVRWKNPRRERWFRVHAAHKAGKLMGVKLPKVPPLASDRLFQMMQTMAERYGCEWKFCGKDETGAVIWELLHRSAV